MHGDGKHYFNATGRFLPYKSFLAERNERLLRHEQLHFDITELYARKIDSALTSFQGCYPKQYSRAIQIHDSLIIEWNKFQELYDKETGHSVNDSAQFQWEKKIRLPIIH